jgi:hypothetical protein
MSIKTLPYDQIDIHYLDVLVSIFQNLFPGHLAIIRIKDIST